MGPNGHPIGSLINSITRDLEASLHRGDGDGADAAAVLWAGSSKKASPTDVARALDVRSSRGPAIGRDIDLAIRALLRRTRSKAGKKDA